MKHIFKSVLMGFALLVPVVSLAQNGVSLDKQVSSRNSDGSYTLTLETYATGNTEVEMNDVPSDIVMILDLSSSMAGSLSYTEVTRSQGLSYNEVVNSGKTYLRRNQDGSSSRYQLFGLERDGYYYLYWVSANLGVLFLDATGGSSYSDAPVYTDSDNREYHNAGTLVGDYSDVTTVSTSTLNTLYSQGKIARSSSPTGTIVNFTYNQNSWRLYSGASRLSELQEGVCEFIDQIEYNDWYTLDENGVEKRRDSRLGNKLSVIVFAGSSFGGKANNYKVVRDLNTLRDGDATNVNSAAYLKKQVNEFTLATGTRPQMAFNKANSLLSVTPGRNRTIVYFTDGACDKYDYNGVDYTPETTVANAYISKNTKDATVYSVGLYSDSDAAKVDKYMNCVSSNFPEAQSTNDFTADHPEDYYFYVSASSSQVGKLKQVFKHIAGKISAQSDNPAVEAHTQVRDIVSSSFVIPDGFDESMVVVYTVDHLPNSEDGWYAVGNHSVPNPPAATAHVKPLTVVTEGTDYLTDDTKVKVTIGTDDNGRNTVWVEGFDYAKDDSAIGAGDGNWVGRRYDSENGFFYAGRKLVIEFNVVTVGDATGGDATRTNDPESGLFILDPDTGEYTSLEKYNIPDTNLPINIIIKKKGLRHGQSATFQIETSPFKRDEHGDIVYNSIGKPDSEYEQNAENWDDLTKIIITNKGEDGAEVTKVLRSFEPDRVYRVREDDWGWSYIVIGNNGAANIPNTSTVETNPFVFENIEKTDAVKHAEAVTINHFSRKNNPGTASAESYKSSKVESFTTPNSSANSGSGSGQ